MIRFSNKKYHAEHWMTHFAIQLAQTWNLGVLTLMRMLLDAGFHLSLRHLARIAYKISATRRKYFLFLD